jgi:hypothetical protein
VFYGLRFRKPPARKIQILCGGNFRKPFDEHTMIIDLAENEEAMGILFSLVPPIGGMAKGRDAEFGCCGLEEFRHLSFLPIEAEKLEEAIRRIKEITVNV